MIFADDSESIYMQIGKRAYLQTLKLKLSCLMLSLRYIQYLNYLSMFLLLTNNFKYCLHGTSLVELCSPVHRVH